MVVSLVGGGFAPALATAKAKYRTGTFAGGTSQGHVITLGADGSDVRGLDSVVFAFCVFPGDARHELHRVRPAGTIAIHNGRFSAPDSPLFDGGSANLSGKLSGSAASGRIAVSYTELELQGATQVLGSCSGQMTWSAKFKRRSYPPGPPTVKPPATPGATFSGQSADSHPVSFLISADGRAVSHITTTYNYSCISGSTGQLDLNSRNQGGPINPANKFFSYTLDAPVAGVSDSAHFSFSGNIDSSGRQATGTMQVSFSTPTGDSCVGDTASWSAHA